MTYFGSDGELGTVHEQACSVFGSLHMVFEVYIQNDGPVTIVLDTDEIMPKRVTVRKAGAKENA